MKNNIFGYIFFIFIIIIMVIAIYIVNSNKDKEDGNSSDVGTTVSTGEKGKELTLAVSGFDTINPIITKNKQIQDITKLIYESLVNVTSDGKVESCLAKEWETTDNLTYIIRLKEGIKWSNGTYLSSDDVKYTIDRLLKDKKNTIYSESVSSLKEVDIIDNTTFRIILSRKIPFYEYYLTFPILCSNYYGDDDFWNTDKNEAPITTGNFQISEHHGNKIILTKNPNWWNRQEKDSVIEKITINFYSSFAELYNAFKMGSIDLISTTNEDYKKYIGKIGYNVTEIEGRNFAFLALNTKSELLSDVNVRKAIRCAINKDEIVSNLYKKTYFKANFPLPLNSSLVDDKNENYFDLGKMEENLKNAGWSFRRKQWQKVVNYKIKKLEFTMVVRKNSNRIKVANYIRDSLAEQGIIINVLQVSDSDYEKYIKNRNYDMILAEMTNPISPDLATYFANGNLANFSNEKTNEIIGYIGNITDKDELKSKFQNLYDIYNEEVPYIGIGRNKIYVITNTYLNAEIDSKWYNLFYKFENWYTNK